MFRWEAGSYQIIKFSLDSALKRQALTAAGEIGCLGDRLHQLEQRDGAEVLLPNPVTCALASDAAMSQIEVENSVRNGPYRDVFSSPF